MPSYPLVAQETGSADIYLVDTVNVQKIQASAALYKAYTALGYAKVTVPAGTLNVFPTVTVTPAGQLATLTSGGLEESALTDTVTTAATAAVKAVFGAAAK